MAVDGPPLASWSYERTSNTTAVIEMQWAIGDWRKAMLEFETKASGTYEVTGGPPRECDPQDHHTDTFQLTGPPR